MRYDIVFRAVHSSNHTDKRVVCRFTVKNGTVVEAHGSLDDELVGEPLEDVMDRYNNAYYRVEPVIDNQA